MVWSAPTIVGHVKVPSIAFPEAALTTVTVPFTLTLPLIEVDAPEMRKPLSVLTVSSPQMLATGNKYNDRGRMYIVNCFCIYLPMLPLAPAVIFATIRFWLLVRLKLLAVMYHVKYVVVRRFVGAGVGVGKLREV